ncbi:MAG: FKBP-type peptidyl-prolyl cis-trans isomerase [Muribaculaceae bacterium]|nr:FKBP-type peptidyl-prolyl cis-trans isomerase [Muribaculaceae bacterium]
MEKIKPGKFVELGYDLYEVAPDGTQTLVHQTDKADPERLVFGVTPGVIVPLEHAIEGLGAGEKFDITVKAADAFGPVDPEQVVDLEKEIFEVDGKFDAEMVKPGAVVPMMTANGYRVMGRVVEVTPTHVKMDFNHPLAGKDVRFNGEILVVRDATAEELAPAQGCCGGGCNCGDGGCEGGCSDGNCCGN